MKRWLVSLSFAALATMAHALPSVANVEAEVQRGNYAQAQSMMREVVAAKPGSAKAHYIYAEILAHNDRFAEAAQEAKLARQLDPSLSFTDPDRFTAFEQLLAHQQQRVGRVSSSGPAIDSVAAATSSFPTVSSPPERFAAQGSGLPGWIWPVGLAALAFGAWKLMSRGRGATTSGALPTALPYGSATGYAQPPAYGPGGGVAPSAAGGLMGMGLAAAGGVAAGMLAEKLLERGHEPRHDDSLFDRNAFSSPPAAIDADAQALETRNIDFGNGNGWDAGSSDGGSMDLGSGGGGDDGGW